MELKVKAASLIDPGSVQVIGTIGDESNALTLVAFRIGIGQAGQSWPWGELAFIYWMKARRSRRNGTRSLYFQRCEVQAGLPSNVDLSLSNPAESCVDVSTIKRGHRSGRKPSAAQVLKR